MRAEGPWLSPRRETGTGRLRLFCLPYAGGGSSLFGRWQAGLPADVEVAPVILPGRDRRMREPALSSMEELTAAMARGLEASLDRPFALFGHSMGALVAHELCHRLEELGLARPEHLFVAGFRAPQLPDRNPVLHRLPDAELLRALEALGGTPPELLECEAIMALVLPTVRSDLRAVETFAWRERPPLETPVTVFTAEDDPLVDPAEMEPWRERTRACCEVVRLAGGHFFLEERRDEILRVIGGRLARHLE